MGELNGRAKRCHEVLVVAFAILSYLLNELTQCLWATDCSFHCHVLELEPIAYEQDVNWFKKEGRCEKLTRTSR